MAQELQQTVAFCEESASAEWLESGLPLALRLRRSWSTGDVWELRNASSDDDEFALHPEGASPLGRVPSSPVKSICCSVSTCDDDVVSLTSDGTCMEDSVEFASCGLDWAEEMRESPAPKSCRIIPGTWVILCQTPSATALASPPGQWRSGPGKFDGPPGNLAALEQLDAPPRLSHTPPGNLAVPPGKFADPAGKILAPPEESILPTAAVANQIGDAPCLGDWPSLGDSCKRVRR